VASPSAKYCQVYSIGAGNGIVHLCGVTWLILWMTQSV
jgi:hypothetical protein